MNIHRIHDSIRLGFPQWQTQAERYKEVVASKVTQKSVILDIGCGRSGYMCDVFSKGQKVIGQDPDKEAILEHPCLDQRIIGDLKELSLLDDSSVDIITSSWVLEHIENPDILLKEVHRLLKMNGCFIALTPNKNSLVSLLSRVIPNNWHGKIVEKLWGRQTRDTYPTYYRANSISFFRNISRKHSLNLEKMTLLKDPSYYIPTPFLAKTGTMLHKKLIPHVMSEGILVIFVKK